MPPDSRRARAASEGNVVRLLVGAFFDKTVDQMTRGVSISDLTQKLRRPGADYMVFRVLPGGVPLIVGLPQAQAVSGLLTPKLEGLDLASKDQGDDLIFDAMGADLHALTPGRSLRAAQSLRAEPLRAHGSHCGGWHDQ